MAPKGSHLLIDGCNLGLRLVTTAVGSCQLLPTHGQLVRRRSDAALLLANGVLRALGELARAGSGSSVHVIIDGKASGGALAGTSCVVSCAPPHAALTLGAGALAARCAGTAPAEARTRATVRVSVTQLCETADDRIALECEQILSGCEDGARAAGPSAAAAGPDVGTGQPSAAALSRAMGLGEDGEGARALLGLQQRRSAPPVWVALRLRRVAGGSAPRPALSPFGLASRAARTLVLKPGLTAHDALARHCAAALEPAAAAAPPSAAAAGRGDAGASRGLLPGTGRDSRDSAVPAVGPFDIALERLSTSRVLVVTRDSALSRRCASLGALCSSSSLADLAGSAWRA